MKIVYPSLARKDYYDRFMSIKSIFYNGSAIAPHAATNRASYTVPGNKRAVLIGGMVYVARNTVAAPVGWVNTYIYITTNAVTRPYLFQWVQQNTIGNVSQQIREGPVWLGASDVVDIFTADGSTGGDNNYILIADIMEFDT